MSELMPCPNASIHEVHLRIWHDDSGYRIYCRDCGLQGPVCMTEEEAVRDWDAMGRIDYKVLAQDLAVFAKGASYRIFGETFPGHPEYVACEAILDKIEKAGLVVKP